MSRKRLIQLCSVFTIVVGLTSVPSQDAYASGGGCTAGGEGASYCSIGACSVTCRAGYYACCNAAIPSCYCQVQPA